MSKGFGVWRLLLVVYSTFCPSDFSLCVISDPIHKHLSAYACYVQYVFAVCHSFTLIVFVKTRMELKDARFEVLTAVLLEIQVFSLCCCVAGDCNVFMFRIKHLMKAVQSFDRLHTTHPTAHHHIPEDLHLQK
jgi:hypothetical protein